MRKKGFTLIELLAVIVILAIISLIAVPIILQIIEDSKNSAEKEGIYLYIDAVQKMITKKQLSDPNFNPDKCEIQSDGNLKCYKNDDLIDILDIDMYGKVPSEGVIKIDKSKINYRNVLYENKYYHKNKEGNASITDNEKYAELIIDADSDGEISTGDKYSYKVNSTYTLNFYVLLVENNKVSLIMDNNICYNGRPSLDNKCPCPWHYGSNDSNYGPDTAMQTIYNATKNWKNVPDIIMNYEDESNRDNSYYGYRTIITDINTKVTTIIGKRNKVSENQIIGNQEYPLKARLPMEQEVKNAGCKLWSGDASAGSCPVWLVENLGYRDITNYIGYDKYSINIELSYSPPYTKQAYWLLASGPNRLEFTYALHNTGTYGISSGTNDNYFTGVRPVIEVPIEYLE